VQGYQVPAKLFEYFAAKRPILAIKYDEADIAGRLVEERNRGLVVQNRRDMILQALEQLYLLWKNNRLDTCFSLEEMPEFTWERIVDKVEGALYAACISVS
jgi:hypothetical protein